MANKINTKVGDLFITPLYEKKRKELEDLKTQDLKENPKNFSGRSWMLIFQTLEFVFKDAPIKIYNRNQNQKPGKNKTKRKEINE
jgi:hypothetical protein